jgi:hypothetical protein
MPTILFVNGFRIVIYTKDHVPPHVHVYARGCEAIVLLNCSSGPPTLRDNFGFGNRDLRAIFTIVQTYVDLLCRTWEFFHVQP